MSDTPEIVTEVVELLRARSGHGMVAWRRDPRDPSRINTQLGGVEISISEDTIEFPTGYTYRGDDVATLYTTASKWAQDISFDDLTQHHLEVIRNSLK